MCGIVGILGAHTDDGMVLRMLDVIHHRGPDSQGYYQSGEVRMGYCRLAINDLSERANQPFRTEDESVAAATNGEIYNFVAIRSELIAKGYRFSSNSDCELILHAYLDRGIEFIPDLNGMFAIAIWDGREKALFLIRDRLGIKPLYYTQTKNHFLFASELKALAVCKDVNLSLDLQSFGEYLVFENFFGAKTLNKEIKMVEPGQFIKIRGQDLSIQRRFFWQPHLSNDEDRSCTSIHHRYLTTLEESVDRHLVSDVPIGCYLSSGIDSSSVAYWASRKLRGRLKTYTGHFGIDGYYNEADGAKRIADHFGCTNERVDIRPRDFSDRIDEVIYHLDEPRVGMGSFSQYMVAMRASQSVKVILTGHGGDEFYAGYPVFKAIHGRRNFLKLFLSSSPRELMFYVYFSLFPMMREGLRYFLPNIFSKEFLKKVLSEEFHAELMQRTHILEEPKKLRSETTSQYEHLFLTYLKFYLPALFVVEDKISMAFSLESRTPLCDNQMLDLALRIPLDEKLGGCELKHIPRSAMRGRLPEFVFALPKRGFPTPLRIWFRNELRDFIRNFILDNFSELDSLFRRSKVEHMINSYQNARVSTPYDEIRAHRLWILLNLIVYFKHQKNRYRRIRPQSCARS
jgi:asparagine synthase (glutamine-hydrolysing)